MGEGRTPRFFRASGFLCPAWLLWIFLVPGAALAAPLDLVDPVEGSRGIRIGAETHAALGERVAEAAEELRTHLADAPACRLYFQSLGVDLEDWLSPGGPPYVVPRPLGRFSGRHRERICGGAQNRRPFEKVFVDWRCFRGTQLCELASLLLHELGHLARRDTTDHEPPDFFDACRLGPCIDPARYE
ncbi:MAG: hypothetical protein MI919_23140 [Holophagales bacterium]|nr:hypothetical protein [Holophagales bacterium]